METTFTIGRSRFSSMRSNFRKNFSSFICTLSSYIFTSDAYDEKLPPIDLLLGGGGKKVCLLSTFGWGSVTGPCLHVCMTQLSQGKLKPRFKKLLF